MLFDDYPDPNDLSPEELMEAGELFLEREDYGAARYYSTFAHSVWLRLHQDPMARIELGYDRDEVLENVKKSYHVTKAATDKMLKDLGTRVQIPIRISTQNLNGLFHKHSPHQTELEQLIEKYGQRYTFKPQF